MALLFSVKRKKIAGVAEGKQKGRPRLQPGKNEVVRGMLNGDAG